MIIHQLQLHVLPSGLMTNDRKGVTLIYLDRDPFKWNAPYPWRKLAKEGMQFSYDLSKLAIHALGARQMPTKSESPFN